MREGRKSGPWIGGAEADFEPRAPGGGWLWEGDHIVVGIGNVNRESETSTTPGRWR